MRRSNLILEKASNHPLLLIFTHWLCLAAMDFPYWKYIGFFILGVTFIPYDRVRVVSFLNIAFFLVTGGLLSVTAPGVNSEIQFSQASPITVLGSAGLIAAIYFGLFQLMVRRRIFRHPVALCFAIVCTLSAIYALYAETLFKIPLLYYFVVASFTAMIRVFWSLCYQLSEVDTLRTKPFWEHLGTLAFPWQFGWASPNIVRGYSDLKNVDPETEEAFKKSQVSGLKLMVCALLTSLAAEQFSNSILSRTDTGGEFIVSPLSAWLGIDLSTTAYLGREIPPYAAWIFVFATSIHFLLALSATTNAAVSIARMCGFMVFRHVYKPLQATTFNIFLGRMYYYYIAILLRFFFYPLWRVLRPVKEKRLRIFLTHFLTILAGGFLTTTLRTAPFTIYYLFTPLFDMVMFRWPYLVALSAISGLSAILPAWDGLGRFRGVWYFTIYTLCFSLQIHFWDSTTTDAWRAFLHLFGL